MAISPTRRRFFGLLVAPAIVRAASLDGLALLRPVRLTTSIVPISSVVVDGAKLFVHLADGTEIGPLAMPSRIERLGLKGGVPNWLA